MIASSGSEIICLDRWSVNEMELSKEKMDSFWTLLQRHRTLFSDITRGDPGNFVNTITAPGTMWFEVRESGTIVGIVWFGDMDQIVDCTAHLVFFDRKPMEKVEVCKEIVRWMFEHFPLHRITVTPPKLYWATSRLLEKIGMKFEGCKREAVLLHNKWNDVLIYGITRRDAEQI